MITTSSTRLVLKAYIIRLERCFIICSSLERTILRKSFAAWSSTVSVGLAPFFFLAEII